MHWLAALPAAAPACRGCRLEHSRSHPAPSSLPPRPPARPVVNYRVPVCESRDAVLDNCRKIAATVAGLKAGYPGLDLVVL